MGKIWSLVIAFAVAILVAGCATTVSAPPITDGEINLVWPETPEKARIKYVRQFNKPADLGLRTSFSRKLRDALAGSDDRIMTRPYAVATNGKNVVVADPGAAIVHVFNMERRTYRQLGKAGKQNFVSPIGVAFGGENLYIADSVLNTIFVLNERLEISTTIENLQRPTSLAFDEDKQRLYVAETMAHKIRVFDEDGGELFSIGERGEAEAQFNFPSHLAFANNRLFVNDTMNFRIQVLDPRGHHLQTFGKHGVGSGHLTQPKGVAVDAMGHVYVADALSNRVQIFKQDGTFLLAFGGAGDGPGTFQMPAGLAIWDDMVYVADSFNHRVQVFRYLREES